MHARLGIRYPLSASRYNRPPVPAQPVRSPWKRPTTRKTSSSASTSEWEANGWFAPSGQGQPYCIVIPPPNVTGTLHMGHAFQHTLMDVLTRLHACRATTRCGSPARITRASRRRWSSSGSSTRKARIAATSVASVRRARLGWKAQSGDTISRQERRLGNSVDWSRDRFTMDEGLSRAVTEVFVRLYEEGLIYRGKRLVNWDPVLHTALSDLEVLAEPEQGQLVAFPLSARRRQRIISSSRRRVRRRCSATPRSPCIPTTSATGIWSASRSACRSPIG